MIRNIFAVLLLSVIIHAQEKHFIIVNHDGTGDFKTLTEAVNSLPMFNYERKIIYLMNGIYNEKIRIEQNYITLKGESREGTIIQFNQLREDWNTNKDSIGPAVINIHADDIILDNLTVINTQPEIGPHAFTVYGTGTRTIITNCNVKSKGGDTVSLWDYKTGMYYHANCYFEGAVDFVCPRGWCFIKDSQFYEVKKTAAIWHAGGEFSDQKFVIRNSVFGGVKDFYLGRHHYDAQFYLLDCTFSDSMSDKPIFRVTYKDNPERDRPFNWGPRYYFYNCTRETGNYNWFADNLDQAEGNPLPEDITPEWTFAGRWNPESDAPPQIKKYSISGDTLKLIFDENISVLDFPVLTGETGKEMRYTSGRGSNTLIFESDSKLSGADLKGLIISSGDLTGTIASIHKRSVVFREFLFK